MDKKKKTSPEKENEDEKLPYDPELNREDRQALPDENLSMDMEDDRDRFLAERKRPVDFTGEDLDIPEKDLEVGRDGLGIPDEENQQYSDRRPKSKEDKDREVTKKRTGDESEPETDNPI